MTSNKRSGWRRASRDLAAANHNRMSRRDNPIPTTPDAGTKLAAVRAAAAKRKNTTQLREDCTMHDAVRKDLILRLQRLSADQRDQLFAEAAAADTAEAGKEAAAEALSELVRPTRKD